MCVICTCIIDQLVRLDQAVRLSGAAGWCNTDVYSSWDTLAVVRCTHLSHTPCICSSNIEAVIGAVIQPFQKPLLKLLRYTCTLALRNSTQRTPYVSYVRYSLCYVMYLSVSHCACCYAYTYVYDWKQVQAQVEQTEAWAACWHAYLHYGVLQWQSTTGDAPLIVHSKVYTYCSIYFQYYCIYSICIVVLH
jgi:hypothetical protein